jgi:hypothetical protein
MENSMELSQKMKTEPSFNPAILLLGIYPKKMKSAYHEPHTFIAALCTVDKVRNPSRCPSTDRQSI